jgi:molybdate transport system ATP-binding protein
VRSELAELLATLRIPTVLVSHDPADAVCFPDRVLVLEGGTVAAQASLGSLDPSTSAFVAAFLGAAATALRP